MQGRYRESRLKHWTKSRMEDLTQTSTQSPYITRLNKNRLILLYIVLQVKVCHTACCCNEKSAAVVVRDRDKTIKRFMKVVLYKSKTAKKMELLVPNKLSFITRHVCLLLHPRIVIVTTIYFGFFPCVPCVSDFHSPAFPVPRPKINLVPLLYSNYNACFLK